MSEINSPEELKKMLGNRIKKLTKSDENLHSLGIKEDTLSKYYKGQRFPTTENLVKIQKRYKVPYAYLFGDTDNDNPNFAEISCKLGLTKKSIEKLLTINKTENQEKKNIQLFALNQLIEKIDFLELGKFMLVPDEKNSNIKSENIYDYFSDYTSHGMGETDYIHVMSKIEREKDYYDFLINKKIVTLINEIRNSEECANIFINYVNNQRKYIEEIQEFLHEPLPDEDFVFDPTEDMIKSLEEDQKATEIRNQLLIEKRKKDLGI